MLNFQGNRKVLDYGRFWTEVDKEALTELIAIASIEGFYITFGPTKHGRCVSVSFYNGGEPTKKYPSTVEEFDALVKEATELIAVV